MDEREILKAYWKAKAEELSRGVDIPLNPVCDSCNKSLDNFPDDCYYFVIGDRLRCGACTEEALARWIKDGKHPDYFGRGELENALAWYRESKGERESFKDDQGENWTKAVAKQKISVYSSTNTSSQPIATIEVDDIFELGKILKESSKKWVNVRLPNGQIGFIPGDSRVISEQTMLGDIDAWSWGLIVIGIMHMILPKLLLQSWGILLVLVGVIARFIKKRFMFIVFGIVLLSAGLMNLSGGGLETIWFLAVRMGYSRVDEVFSLQGY